MREIVVWVGALIEPYRPEEEDGVELEMQQW